MENTSLDTTENTDKEYITKQFISLERIILSKNKTLLRYIPRPVMRWFKKLIHLDEINAIIYKHRHKFGIPFATAVLEEELNVTIEVVNPENIPISGRFLVVSNHPLGGVDGMALISEIGKRRSDILFPVNDILCNLPGLKPIFIPINKYGNNSANHNTLDKAFASDACLLFFPAGTESRRFKGGEVKDLPWKHSFIKKTFEHHRDVIPVYIDAQNTNFFYRFAKWRKRLGIKFNIELVLLPDQMFKFRNKKIRLTFGKPIPWETFDDSKKPKEWTLLVRNNVYNLKNNPQTEFHTL